MLVIWNHLDIIYAFSYKIIASGVCFTGWNMVLLRPPPICAICINYLSFVLQRAFHASTTTCGMSRGRNSNLRTAKRNAHVQLTGRFIAMPSHARNHSLEEVRNRFWNSNRCPYGIPGLGSPHMVSNTGCVFFCSCENVTSSPLW